MDAAVEGFPVALHQIDRFFGRFYSRRNRHTNLPTTTRLRLHNRRPRNSFAQISAYIRRLYYLPEIAYPTTRRRTIISRRTSSRIMTVVASQPESSMHIHRRPNHPESSISNHMVRNYAEISSARERVDDLDENCPLIDWVRTVGIPAPNSLVRETISDLPENVPHIQRVDNLPYPTETSRACNKVVITTHHTTNTTTHLISKTLTMISNINQIHHPQHQHTLPHHLSLLHLKIIPIFPPITLLIHKIPIISLLSLPLIIIIITNLLFLPLELLFFPTPEPPPYYSPYEQTYAPAPPQPVSIPTNNPNSYGGPPYESRGGNNNYLDESLARYGGVQQQQTQPQEPVYNRSRSDAGYLYDRSSVQEDLYGQNAYAYDGGKVEPYGARGTSGKSGSSFSAAFDDYGRSLTGPAKENVSLNKVLKAVPKVETQQDVKNGVQKFRVKLLAESGGQSPMDVLCQIGLDGIRMLDPNSGRTLRIYPLETITRSEVLDSSIFAFWSKSTVDIEPRRIRLKSSSYTTNTILDTVTAATIQLKEIGGDSLRSRQSDSGKQSEQLAEKKKGFDWVNLIKPGNEEKDHWVPDEAVTKCTSCGTDFGAFVRKHHCRNCGDIFCDKCTHGRIALTAEENAQQVRVCDRCLAEVTQRLSNVKESASKPALCSHEDLAKKLQDEMEKNRKASSGSKSSDGSGRRMKEVACPTCTVHLQVQVPSSGSETIECGVCQHPFLVSAN
ncbi:hypothetical protein IFM89_021464 [Coptis chinensis]|uniref:FYVE-type domain-containing protein n=1 Tax=Coptis chinensis TaxID=261450 RepID=A0A835IM07_9MAGN|nr:hypothetical protein IFM89_021464 [Coptis chinensis]